ncbi:MAG: CHAP domain-containing protein, partial [Bacteroidota bacterium]|nr:CHAP domain-containing protein [Bacteroidota bacterium]
MKTIKSNFPIFIFFFLLLSLNIQSAQGETKEKFEVNIVKAWGSNNAGQLGNDTVGEEPEGIVDVLGLENVAAVAAGYIHSMALTEDGQVWAWGNNIEGQIGVGKQGRATPDIPLPVRVFGPYETDADDDGKPDGGTYLTDIVAIATSDCHNLALSYSGKVYAWGENHKGQCGCDEKWNNKITPVEVMKKIGECLVPISGIIAIATGSNHSMALTSDGEVYTWGYNSRGQLGNPPITDDPPYFLYYPISKTAVKVWADQSGTPLTDVNKIGAGRNHSFAILDDGNTAAWGENKKGQLGIGYFGDKEDLPVNVINITNIIAIDGGEDHSIALLHDGSVYSWGDNKYGQLGNGKVNNGIIDPQHDPYDPDFVHGENDTGHLSCIRKIAVGAHHNLVIRNNAFSGDYEVMAWGKNDDGQVDADPTSDHYPFPIVAPNLDKRGKKVAAGFLHSLALIAPPWALIDPPCSPIDANVGNLRNVVVHANGCDFNNRWQCVEFAKRFFHRYHHYRVVYTRNTRPPGWSGDGKTWHQKPGMVSYSNDNSAIELPELGDTLAFDGSPGHVAIVSHVDREKGRIYFYQQNIHDNNAQIVIDSVTYHRNAATSAIEVNNYKNMEVRGWGRPQYTVPTFSRDGNIYNAMYGVRNQPLYARMEAINNEDPPVPVIFDRIGIKGQSPNGDAEYIVEYNCKVEAHETVEITGHRVFSNAGDYQFSLCVERDGQSVLLHPVVDGDLIFTILDHKKSVIVDDSEVNSKFFYSEPIGILNLGSGNSNTFWNLQSIGYLYGSMTVPLDGEERFAEWRPQVKGKYS